MRTFKGTSDYLGNEYANKLVIKADKAYSTSQTVDGIQKIGITMNTNAPVYSTGTDQHGGKYEHLQFNSGNWYYSIANLSMNEYTQESFSIRTWDRKTLFVTFTYKHKGFGRGKNWYPDSSDKESIIIDLDEESSKQLSTWLDTLK